MHETTDELAKPNEDIVGGRFGDMGTHFATGVMYGAEIVVSFQFKPSTETSKYVWSQNLCALPQIISLEAQNV